MRLDGKVVLVTGGGSGIGRASAIALAREGAKVVVADIAVKGGEETVQMLKEAVFVKADVSKAAEVEALVNKVIKIYGRLDCAYNNAGNSDYSDIATATTPINPALPLAPSALTATVASSVLVIPQILTLIVAAILNALHV